MQIAEKKWFVNLGSHMISSQSFWLWKENVWYHIVLCLKERIDWKTKNYLFDFVPGSFRQRVCVNPHNQYHKNKRWHLSDCYNRSSLWQREHRYSMEHWFLTARVALSMVTKGAWIYLMLAPICVPVTAWDDNLVESHWKPSENLTKSMLHL